MDTISGKESEVRKLVNRTDKLKYLDNMVKESTTRGISEYDIGLLVNQKFRHKC